MVEHFLLVGAHMFFPGGECKYIIINIYIVFSNLQIQPKRINDIKRIHSFKADPNISVIWNVGDWCSMITLTLQHHVGVFFGVGTAGTTNFSRYSLIGPHTPSAIKMEPNIQGLLFKRGDFFWGNAFVVSTLRDFVKVFFSSKLHPLCFFSCLGSFLSSNAFLEDGRPGNH